MRRQEPTLDIDELAGTLQGKLEGVKLGDAVDAAFKGGVWVSCIVGTKFLLDKVSMTEMFTFARENQEFTKTAFSSFLIGQVSAPLALIPILKTFLKEAQEKEDLKALAVEAGLVYQYSQTLNPVTLALLIINSPDAIQALMLQKQREQEDQASQVEQIQAKIDQLEAEILAILESGEKAGIGSREAEIERLRTQLAAAKQAEADLRDSQVVFAEAQKRAESMLKWGIAVTVGTYLAGSMVYAGDTLLDSIQGAFNMFKIPFKGGV